MLVKALSNRLEGTLAAYYVSRGYSFPDTLNITKGKEYEVRAVSWKIGRLWYYIFDDSECNYPIMYLAELFDIVDGNINRSWIFAGEKKCGGVIISEPEWALDDGYYARLVDLA